MRITSYAKAFPRDRRIYRIDRWTIPIPGGLPLAASAWFLLLALIVLVLGQISPFKQAVQSVGWPAAMLVGPGPISIALTRRTADDRSLPTHIRCAARWRLARIMGSIRAPILSRPAVRELHAACDNTLSPSVNVIGPGRVALGDALDLARSTSGALIAMPAAATQLARVVQLEVGERIEVRA